MGTNLLVSIALETCATIPPNVDATLDISARLQYTITVIAKFELLELHSKACSFV